MSTRASLRRATSTCVTWLLRETSAISSSSPTSKCTLRQPSLPEFSHLYLFHFQARASRLERRHFRRLGESVVVQVQRVEKCAKHGWPRHWNLHKGTCWTCTHQNSIAVPYFFFTYFDVFCVKGQEKKLFSRQRVTGKLIPTENRAMGEFVCTKASEAMNRRMRNTNV